MESAVPTAIITAVVTATIVPPLGRDRLAQIVAGQDRPIRAINPDNFLGLNAVA
jgi:hypothetical protein